MILLVSLILDAGFLTIELAKRRQLLRTCQLTAMSAIINTCAYYVSAGLTAEFGDSLPLKIICTAAAKVFVAWFFLQKKKPAENMLPIYLMSAAVSLCIHSEPFTGLCCDLVLLFYLFYCEKMSQKTPSAEASLRYMPGEANLYLQTIEDSYRKNRALMHDLNNHAIAMRALADSGQYEELAQYIDTFSQKVKDSMFPVHSGNIVLDALLADKYHRAAKWGIPVFFEKVQYQVDFNSEDLCTVIGNLFDNAIEENIKCQDAKRRRISLCIMSNADSLSITVKNPLFHKLKLKNGLPASEKPSSEHHGIGLKNVRRVCDQYRGTLVWDISEGNFSITAELNAV